MKMKVTKSFVRAYFEPESYNSEKRTIDVVFTTGSRVKRYDWMREEFFYEELAVTKEAVRLERMNAGAPVLNNHGTWGGGLRDIMGVVESAEIRDGKGYATLRFSERDDVAPLVQDIKAGIIRNVSVGYKINKFERTDEMVDGKFRVMRAVDWEPMEVSFVGIPADMGAQARSELPVEECEVITATTNQSEGAMKRKVEPEKETRTAPAGETTPSAEVVAPAVEPTEPTRAEPTVEAIAPATTPSPTPEEVRQAEIGRQKEIREAVRAAGLKEEFADKLVNDDKMTVDNARKLVLKELETQTSTRTFNQRIEVNDMDQRELRKEAATRALLNRGDADKFKLKGDENEFRQGSLIDTARHFLALEGVRDAYTMSRVDLAKRALHSSSDFPEVLANTANKSLRAAYEGVPNTYSPFTSMRSANDFKELSSIQLGNGGKLEKVNEHGEYKRTTLGETAEKYKVEKFGLVLGRTWELLVNDDMDAFSRIPARLGRRAAEKENEIFWSLVTANAGLGQTMAETGNTLFHATHGNLNTTPAAIDIAPIGTGRAAMRLFKDLDGELMSIAPSYLVVPAALETKAQQFLTQITANQSDKVNPFPGTLLPIVEPRLDAISAVDWFLFADKGKLDMAEMAQLDNRGPEIFVREGFDVDGMEIKLRYVFGMKIVDFRGFYKQEGA